MSNIRRKLRDIHASVDESMGVRSFEIKTMESPRFSPMPADKDVGRLPLRTFGQLDIDRVMPDPIQPRSEFDDEEIQRLAGSIADKGQLHPIRVRWDAGYNKWIIISGERRYRATRVAGLKMIDCYFHEGDLTPAETLSLQVVENLVRSDLRPLEQARVFAILMELNGWNGKQLAQSLRLSTSKVSRALALLDLPIEIQEKVNAGGLARTSAYELTKISNDDTRRVLAEKASHGAMTQRDTARAVNQHRGKSKPKARSLQKVFLAENGIRVTVSAIRSHSYHTVLEALKEAMEEVQHRIDNNVHLA